MKKIKRLFLKNGLIISLLTYPIISFISIILLALNNRYEGEVILFLFIIISTIIGFFSTLIGLLYCKKPYYLYKKKSMFVVISFLFLLIIDCLMLTYIIRVGFKENLVFFTIYSVFLIGPIFTIIGFFKAKQSSYQEEIIKENRFSSDLEKFEKLTKFREANLITETEYKTLIKKR